jgi:hypothetical protein
VILLSPCVPTLFSTKPPKSCDSQVERKYGLFKKLLDEILKGCHGPDDFYGPQGSMKQLAKALVERAIEAELTERLGYEKHGQGEKTLTNRRNGKTAKELRTDESAAPHEKSNRNGLMPQIENVTQNTIRAPEGGRPNGLNYARETGGNEGISPRYQKTAKKEQKGLPDDFTRLTGYHRKSAVRLLNAKPVREVLAHGDGKPVTLKPAKRRPANRKGKRLYTDELIAALRLVRSFFWYKCGKLMRRQTRHIARRPAFNIAPETAGKLARISPATIDRSLKKTGRRRG